MDAFPGPAVPSDHMGETGDERIVEHVHVDGGPVAALREGTYLDVDRGQVVVCEAPEHAYSPSQVHPETMKPTPSCPG